MSARSTSHALMHTKKDNFCPITPIVKMKSILGVVKFTKKPYKVKSKTLRALPVIQATGRSEFKDGLGSGDFVSCYSYHMIECPH
jgi:hypothetical protein